MKYLSLPICVACITFSLTAEAAENGYFYIAADAGVFQADMTQSYLDRTDVIPQNIVESVIQHGYTGGVAVGYRHYFCEEYFLGGELSANFDTQKASFQSGSPTFLFSDSTQIQNHFDLTFVPGLHFTDTLLAYLKLGVSFASIEDNLTSPVGFLGESTNFNSNKTGVGFVAGLGVSKWITSHISIFTEAYYRDYGSITFKNFQNFTADYTHTAHIYSSDVVLGAAYNFV